MKIRKLKSLVLAATLLLSFTHTTQALVSTTPGATLKFVQVAVLPASTTTAGASKANINVITKHPAITGSTLNNWVTVVDGRGPIRLIDPTGANSPILIINMANVAPWTLVNGDSGAPAGNSELGVRGFAYHPDFANPNATGPTGGYLKFYTMSCLAISTRTVTGARVLNHDVPPGYPLPLPQPQAPLCDNVLTEWKMTSATTLTADPASRREILRFPQLFKNHGTDTLVFDPATKLLYISVGDGGNQGDPLNVANNVEYLYGKIMRINPLPVPVGTNPPTGTTASSDRQWSYPTTNPGAGALPGRNAYYVKGLRHPETMFKNGTDLVVADIGGSAFEEINILKLSGDEGNSFGWHAFEGRAPLDTTATTIPPVAGYTRTENYYPDTASAHPTAVIVGGVPTNLNVPFATTTSQLILGDIITGNIYYGGLAAMKAARSWTTPMVTVKKAALVNASNVPTTLLATYGQVNGKNRVDLRLAEIGGTIYGTSKQAGVLFKLVAP